MAILTPSHYAFSRVILRYGAHVFSGFAEGDAISFDPNADTITSAQGADGETVINTRTLRNSRLTVRLMASSLSNSYLSALFATQALAGFSGTYPPLNLTDLSTQSTITAPQAWIVQQPPTSFGEESGTVEWIFEGPFVALLKGSAI